MASIVLSPSLKHKRIRSDRRYFQRLKKIREQQNIHADHLLGIRPEGASRFGRWLDIAVEKDIVRFHASVFQHDGDLIGAFQEIERDVLDVAGEAARNQRWSAGKAVDLGPALGGLREDF